MTIAARTSVTLPGTDTTVLDLAPPSLWLALGSIAFNPTFWNIVARREHRTHWLTRLFGGAYAGCYALAFTIFTLGLLRDYLYAVALDDQPVLDFGLAGAVGGAVCLAVGNVLVLSSMWRLGVTGTYLGDYFGILMNERVTAFPFNTMENPMYNGSTLCFLGTALWKGSPAGILISVYVYIVYLLALAYEGPFTAAIYAKRDKERRAKQE
ncbi:Phosphatidyl-N-methylethanolamine N-methyltransferase [Allomyces arbusculus]|nr:Phosphatidyl-N-methylethanolamine N-methyltransferase [Allomyces arbusculus]